MDERERAEDQDTEGQRYRSGMAAEEGEQDGERDEAGSDSEGHARRVRVTDDEPPNDDAQGHGRISDRTRKVHITPVTW